ncbi:nuclear transport factor 2 family protein [Pararobbsia silviterrae]|uniref:Nuclear transport factor 2 family protein n=1 Tax=Pararobbsia silviterrae TaxID=1792498 RepID=A0A494XX08_9BURK|nr:nuclear transport factor 2 family protein [Pararobbsia silviterrae]RKP53538.1 nuclear transport factor 2 family protein [Pararobbsia silviterrae]
MDVTLDSIERETEAILAVERRRQHALIAVDLGALDALFAEDLVHVHSTGRVHDKTALLRHIERKRGFIAIERGALTIRIEGAFAVMTGPMRSLMREADGSTAWMPSFVTQVLRRDAHGWRFISFQLTVDREA